MTSFKVQFNPGNFGAVLGHYSGSMNALARKRVNHAVSEGFLKYTMKRAFKRIDMAARTGAGALDGGPYKYAYAGGHPDNVGSEYKRLFKATPIEKKSSGWSISYEILPDTEPAWSPVLMKNTEYIYRDRMKEALAPKTVEVFRAPTSLGKNFYAVAREEGKVIYRRAYIKEMGGKDFDAELESKLEIADQEAQGLVSSHIKGAITRAVNKKTGVSGRGFAGDVMDGYARQYSESLGRMEAFMYAEMAKVIAEA